MTQTRTSLIGCGLMLSNPAMEDSRLLVIIVCWLFTHGLAQEVTDPCNPATGAEVFTTVSESVSVGDVVYTVKVPGNSSTVSLSANTNPLFLFNATSREILVKSTLDAETNTMPESLTITCTVLGTQLTRSMTVYISITDANDHSPVFDKPVYNITVGEMTEVNTVITTGIVATDGDATPDFNFIYYSILDGPYKDYFNIGNPTKTDLTLLKAMDYETLPQLNITIMAMDQPTSGNVQFNTTCALVIIVEDQDDQNPVFNNSLYRGVVTNSTTLDSVLPIIPSIFAYDPDLSLKAKVVYSFHGPIFFYHLDQSGLSHFDSKSQSNSVFNIDPVTAEVTLVSQPNAEQVYLLVQVTQVDNPSRYGVALLTIDVQDSYQLSPPVFTRSSYNVVIPEVFPIGQVVTAVFAFSSNLVSTVKYSLDDPSGTFEISSTTGDIILKKGLVSSASNQFSLTVMAADGVFETQAQLRVQVVPSRTTPPVILNSSLNVTALRKKGDLIIDITAEDSDGGSNVTYSLLSYNQLFSIDQDGILTITAEPENLVLSTYPLTVVVSDSRQPSFLTVALVTVTFPDETVLVASGQVLDGETIAAVVLGVLAGILLVIVILLVLYILRRRLHDREDLDRVKKPHQSQVPKALAFTQKQGILGFQTKPGVNNPGSSLFGDISVQENPLTATSKGGYFNFGGNSDAEMEMDMQEVASNFEQHNEDGNNNEHIYNSSQGSVDSHGYSTAGKTSLTPFFRNGSLKTCHGSNSDDSDNVSHSVSSDSPQVFQPEPKPRTHVPEEPAKRSEEEKAKARKTNSFEKSLPFQNEKSKPDHSPAQKQELTVYF